jgi:hypothetical protein
MLVPTDYVGSHLRKLYMNLKKSCVLVCSIDNQVQYCFIRKHLIEQAKTEFNGCSIAQHILN